MVKQIDAAFIFPSDGAVTGSGEELTTQFGLKDLW
jgi:hypothetical protein